MEQYITVKKGRTFLVYDTPGELGTIIAVHGLTGNHKQFYHYQKAFTGKYRFISYDVRGRGNSEQTSKDTSIYTHADDLIELIEELGIKRPILMGYSMGAYISAIVASRLSDVEALILLDGAGEADDMTRQLVLPSLNRLKKVFPSVQEYVHEVKGLYTNLRVNWNETIEEIVKYDMKKIDSGWRHKSESSFIKQDFETFYTFKQEETCSKIKATTLLFIATGKIGDKAPLFQGAGYTKTRESIRKIETKYTDVNHYELVFNKQPAIVQQIEEFLVKQGVK